MRHVRRQHQRRPININARNISVFNLSTLGVKRPGKYLNRRHALTDDKRDEAGPRRAAARPLLARSEQKSAWL